MYSRTLLSEPTKSGNSGGLLPDGSAAFIPVAEARGLSPRFGKWYASARAYTRPPLRAIRLFAKEDQNVVSSEKFPCLPLDKSRI
jgi:hypothetical protein